MGLTQNKALIFSNVPFGYPIPGKDITVEAREIDLSVALPTNSVSVKNYYASFDPFMRGMLRAPEDKAWVHAYTLREPVTSITVSKVINSLDPSYKEGDLVIGINPIEEYSIVSSQSLQHLQNPFNLDLKLFLGALGMPGQTAYASFYEIGKPTKGETILISAASGAVGQIVGQLAKREGLRVVGSVGSKEKLDFILKDLGFDDGFNYKVKKPVEALKRLTAADTGSSSLGGVFGDKGVDIYFDNVGGEMLEAAIGVMNVKGRIVACGQISQSNDTTPYGIKNTRLMSGKRLTWRGFTTYDENMQLYAKEHVENVTKWIQDGSLKTKESITVGMDNSATGFVGMLKGENIGKAVLESAKPE